MRVGVTGSSGFIGAALTTALEARGDDVVRFVRLSSHTHGANRVRWDPDAGEVDDMDLARAGTLDAVVNLAGAGIADRRWSSDRQRDILESRTKSTALLARTLRSSNTTPFFASGSAIGYYGSRGDELLDETSSPGTDFLADVCVRWEAAANDVLVGAGVAFLRTGIVMSRHGGALKKQLPLFRAGLGGRLGDGRQWLSPISLADEIRGILHVLDHRIAGPVNLCAPTPLTNADFTYALGRLLHRPTILTAPKVAMKVVLGGALTNGAILASQRVHPTTLLEHGFQFEHPDGETILRWALETRS